MRANKSSRSSGAVGPKAVTPRMVLKYIKDTGNKNIKILDFGSGKDAKHTYALRDMGLDVTAHDFSSNVNDDHHDPDALNREYDIVFACHKQRYNVSTNKAVLNLERSPPTAPSRYSICDMYRFTGNKQESDTEE